MRKLILMLMFIFCISNGVHAYEKIGGESIADYYKRKQLIQIVSKDNAKYIMSRIEWYQQFEYEERLQAVWYMYLDVIPKMLEELENGKPTDIK